MKVYFHRWGFQVGPFSMTWLDLWDRTIGLEIVLGNRSVTIGFRKKKSDNYHYFYHYI